MLIRRLLLFAAILLVTMAIASAIAPRDLRDDEPSRTSTTPARIGPGNAGTTPRSTGAASRTVVAGLSATAAGEPRVVRARVGNLIRLDVSAERPDSVTVQGYNRREPVDESTPARFEFFADQPGRFSVQLATTGKVVGVLDVRR